jgi:hypothetical protein
MSTHPTPSPPEPERKPRGCLFYGCLVALVLGLLLLLLVGLGTWAAYRVTNQFLQDFGEDAPAPIPVAERPAADVEALRTRIDAFGEALAAGTATEPLTLTSDEINALIASVPDWKGVIAIELDGDKVRGQLSFPVARLGFPIGTLFPGKYLNGTVTIDARLVDGRPFLAIVEIQARGKPIPENVLNAIIGPNIVEGIENDPKLAPSLRRLRSITVKDSTLILTPMPPPKPEAQPVEPDRPKEPARPEEPARAPG